ncbi:MAG: methyltransferase [Congregibacter sp.]
MLAELREWLLRRRDRILADPAFHRKVLRFPISRWIARRRARELFDITAGFVYSQILAACIRLDLFERLASGPRYTHELIVATGLPEEALERLLEAAAELRLLQRAGAGRWRLGDLGAASLGSPGIAAMVSHHALLYRDLSDPIALLEDRSETALGDYWAYASEPGTSEAENAARYSLLMARSQSFVADDVLAQCPLHDRRHLLDIGGGSGVFAAEAMTRFCHLRATVFDLPDVAALAQERFEKQGLSARGDAYPGNMFADELPANLDVVSLIRILHDHDDQPVRALLKRVRNAMRDDGLLLLAEPMAETSGAPGVGAYFHMYLWAMRSGRPRSLETLTRLLEEAGFADVRERRSYQPLLVRVITARPAAND